MFSLDMTHTFLYICKISLSRTFTMKRLAILLPLLLLAVATEGQIRSNVPKYNPDSVRAELDKRPYFSLFKDNYFIGGTTLGGETNRAELRREVSIKYQPTAHQEQTAFRYLSLYHLHAEGLLECVSKVAPDVRPQFQPGYRSHPPGHLPRPLHRTDYPPART